MAGEPPLASDPAQNKGPELERFFIAFTVVAGFFVIARISIRLSRRLFGWDDFAIGVAMIASILLTCFASVSIHYGYGKHIGDIHPERSLVNALFWFYIAQIAYKCVTWPTKVSILLMYRRIFGDAPDIRAYGVQFKILIRIMLAICIGMFIAGSLVGMFVCLPVQSSWNHNIKGKCVDTLPWWFSYAAFNVLTDCMILALPMPLINGLIQITKRQKIVLMGVFLLGAFVCVVSIIRMTTFLTALNPNDATYTGAATLKWTAIETNVGIICACLPLLRPLLNVVFPWFAQRTTRVTRSRPTYTYGSSAPSGIQDSRPEQRWSNWGRKQNIIMSNVSAQKDESRTSSEAGITESTDGITITRKFDYEESGDETESDKDRKSSHATTADNVV